MSDGDFGFGYLLASAMKRTGIWKPDFSSVGAVVARMPKLARRRVFWSVLFVTTLLVAAASLLVIVPIVETDGLDGSALLRIVALGVVVALVVQHYVEKAWLARRRRDDELAGEVAKLTDPTR